MKLFKIIGIAVLLSFSCYSCSSDNVASSKEAIKLDAVKNTQSNDPDASGENKCLLDYASKYDHLLTEEMVLQATNLPKDKLETKYTKVLNNVAYHKMVYKFKLNRKRHVPEVGMDLEMPEIVSLSGIKAMSARQFEGSYRAMTDEEEANFNEAKKQVLDGNSGNKDAEKALEAAAKQGMDKKQVGKGVDMVSGVMKKVAEAYIVVDGLGDAARWNTYTKEMVVLQSGVQFVLHVDVSDDNKKNQSVATELARQLLKKCS